MKHRQVQHFGYAFRYGTNDVDCESPLEHGIPQQLSFLHDRLVKQRAVKENFIPDQMTVNRYLPGQGRLLILKYSQYIHLLDVFFLKCMSYTFENHLGIPPHVDTHSVFEDPILSLSLLSDVVMDFRHTSGKKIPVLLPRRSLTIMSGESRYH